MLREKLFYLTFWPWKSHQYYPPKKFKTLSLSVSPMKFAPASGLNGMFASLMKAMFVKGFWADARATRILNMTKKSKESKNFNQ